jgi:dihydroorotate dehydrogenase electron transfer subunit
MIFEHQTEIVFNKKVATQTFLMGLRSKEIADATEPGQFVMIQVHGTGAPQRRSLWDPLLRRPFSICGTTGPDVFLVLYRVVGRGTALLQEKREGKRVSVLGPLGKGFHRPGIHTLPVLIAGGIGIAPLLSLAQSLKGREIQGMMGFRSADEVVPMDLAPDLNFQYEISTDDGTKGHGGLVTDLLTQYLEDHSEKKSTLSLFACGSVPMLKQVADMASEHHIPCQVSLESTMACGLGACQGCATRASLDSASLKEGKDYLHVCQDGPVFPVQAIDWNSL